MANTTNLNLVKPDYTDDADIEDINDNSDKIDAFAGNTIANIGGTEFSTSSTYAVGAIVKHDGKLYRCATAVTTAGAWSASNWEEVSLQNEIDSMLSILPESSKIAKVYFDSSGGYYGFDTQNIAASANGFVSIYCAPGANRLQLKYNVNGTLTTKNFTLNEWLNSWLTNTELNNVKTTGTYYIGSGATVGGVASGVAAWSVMTVIAERSDTIVQTVYSSDGKTVVCRQFRNNAWGDFQYLNGTETPTATANTTNTATGSVFPFAVAGKVAVLNVAFSPKTALSANTNHVICTIPSGYRTGGDRWGVAFDRANGQVAYIEAASNGNVTVRSNTQMPTSAIFRGQISWIIGN